MPQGRGYWPRLDGRRGRVSVPRRAGRGASAWRAGVKTLRAWRVGGATCTLAALARAADPRVRGPGLRAARGGAVLQRQQRLERWRTWVPAHEVLVVSDPVEDVAHIAAHSGALVRDNRLERLPRTKSLPGRCAPGQRLAPMLQAQAAAASCEVAAALHSATRALLRERWAGAGGRVSPSSWPLRLCLHSPGRAATYSYTAFRHRCTRLRALVPLRPRLECVRRRCGERRVASARMVPQPDDHIPVRLAPHRSRPRTPWSRGCSAAQHVRDRRTTRRRSCWSSSAPRAAPPRPRCWSAARWPCRSTALLRLLPWGWSLAPCSLASALAQWERAQVCEACARVRVCALRVLNASPWCGAAPLTQVQLWAHAPATRWAPSWALLGSCSLRK